jgi:PAS domain S-box-containing protein
MDTQANYKVLIMEDEPFNLELLISIFKEKYTILPATTGQEAIQIIEKQNFDLAILDIMMPDIDGYEICRRIKTSEKTCLVPVIIITALTDKNSKLKGIENGSDDFLTKPFDKTEVIFRVSQLLEKRALHLKLIENGRSIKKYLDTMKSIFVVINKDQNIEIINNFACEILGFDELEILGKNWFDVAVPKEHSENLKKQFSNLIDYSVSSNTQIEYHIIDKNSCQRIINFNYSCIRDDNDCIQKIIFVGNDITEKKRIEELMKRYTSELEYTNNLNDLIVSIIKYELLNPVHTLKAIIENMMNNEENEYKITMLENAFKINDNLGKTIEKTSLYIENEYIGNSSIKKCSIEDLLNNSLRNYELETQIKKIKIHLNCQNSCQIYDNKIIEDMIKNILSNIIHKSSENSFIIINVLELKESIKIEFGERSKLINCYDEQMNDTYKNTMIYGKSIIEKELLSILEKMANLFGGEVGTVNNPCNQGPMLWITIPKK